MNTAYVKCRRLFYSKVLLLLLGFYIFLVNGSQIKQTYNGFEVGELQVLVIQFFARGSVLII